MPWNLISMTFHALHGKVLFLLFIFSFLMFEAIAFDDKCLSFYSFENESDTPDEKSNFFNNGGWRFDKINKSFESGNQSKDLSSFWTTREGQLNISFEWKISSKDIGIGIFQFQIDGKPFNQSNESNWTKVSVQVPKGKHELKWIVQKGFSQPFTGWIDSLCIRNYSCPKPCPSTIISNQPPILKDFTPSLFSPQEVGASIIWVAEAYDYENDVILYKYTLNSVPVQGWSSNKSWNWKTEGPNLGSNRIEVLIRDGKHAGPESFDNSRRYDFILVAPSVTLIKPNEPPVLTDLKSDKLSPQEVGATVTWSASALDSDNDLIDYKFLLNGANKTEWIANNSWEWKTTENDIRLNQITVLVRDNKHAGISGIDDQIKVDFEIKNNCIINNIAIASLDKVCSGSINNASVPYNENYNYLWKITNGKIISDSNHHRVTWVAESLSSVRLEVTIANKNCESNNITRIQKDVQINPMDSPNNIIDISPSNDSDLAEMINNCDCKTIRFDKGNYTEPIIINTDNIKLLSRSKHEAIINGNETQRCITLNNISNIHIEGFQLNSNNNCAIRVYKSRYSEIRENVISFNGPLGIYMDNSENNSISNNELNPSNMKINAPSKTCIKLDHSNNNSIEENTNLSKCDYVYYLENTWNNSIMYKNIGNFFNNGINCQSNQTGIYCDRGNNINEGGNKWIPL
jgi:parallel beta-helix repeat protein